ncbi:hypothetical protein Mapa_000645 [Marchantia paleacea]|nr:hypothetical protein Mapa_000645 [Marchantia paleacea]
MNSRVLVGQLDVEHRPNVGSSLCKITGLNGIQSTGPAHAGALHGHIDGLPALARIAPGAVGEVFSVLDEVGNEGSVSLSYAPEGGDGRDQQLVGEAEQQDLGERLDVLLHIVQPLPLGAGELHQAHVLSRRRDGIVEVDFVHVLVQAAQQRGDEHLDHRRVFYVRQRLVPLRDLGDSLRHVGQNAFLP